MAELGAFLCTDVVKIAEKEMKIETNLNDHEEGDFHARFID